MKRLKIAFVGLFKNAPILVVGNNPILKWGVEGVVFICYRFRSGRVVVADTGKNNNPSS